MDELVNPRARHAETAGNRLAHAEAGSTAVGQ
jgi:hypothetical protein